MRRGFTLIEVVIGVAITGVIVVAVALFATRGFTIPRHLFSQTVLVRDATKEIERISDVVRNAVRVDGQWLITGSPSTMDVWTNIDLDPEAERVRYDVEGTNLIRTVTDYPGEAQSSTTILTRVKSSQLFRYELGGAVDKVFIHLEVGDDLNSVVIDQEPVVPRWGVLNNGS